MKSKYFEVNVPCFIPWPECHPRAHCHVYSGTGAFKGLVKNTFFNRLKWKHNFVKNRFITNVS